ncbi:MAG: TlpA family protein disulfide reductase [Flavobacteriales bacterium]|nr:TlpA family protein disulfide reductase [Flavobacteriales bacterium]
MIRLLSLLILLLLASGITAQTVTVHGTAPGFVGKHIYLHKYTDYLAQAYEKLDHDIVNEYGRFSFQIQLAEITECFIQIQDKSGILYLDPNESDYYAYFPSTSQSEYYHGKNATLVLDSLSKDDINTLFIDYEVRLDHFLHVGDYETGNDSVWNLAKIIMTREGKDILDQFKLTCKKEYFDVENDFFHQYIQYSIAGYEQFSGGVEYIEFNKAAVCNSYLKNKPILYNNGSYMYFLFDFYEKPFNMIGRANYLATQDIVNETASYSKLLALLGTQHYLKHPQLCELVMMKGILEEYHSGRYYKPNLVHILDSVFMASEYPENQSIAKNIRHILTRLEPGYKAPNFQLITTNLDTVTLDNFKGKYVYLDFFHTQSAHAIAEKLLIPELKEKYGKYIEFVSINLDDKAGALKTYLADNPSYNWTFAHFQGDVSLVDEYNIRSLPSYFLIGPDGRMVDANPLRPSPLSPGAEYSTIDRTFWAIKEKLKPTQKFNIGIKDN